MSKFQIDFLQESQRQDKFDEVEKEEERLSSKIKEENAVKTENIVRYQNTESNFKAQKIPSVSLSNTRVIR